MPGCDSFTGVITYRKYAIIPPGVNKQDEQRNWWIVGVEGKG